MNNKPCVCGAILTTERPTCPDDTCPECGCYISILSEGHCGHLDCGTCSIRRYDWKES